PVSPPPTPTLFPYTTLFRSRQLLLIAEFVNGNAADQFHNEVRAASRPRLPSGTLIGGITRYVRSRPADGTYGSRVVNLRNVRVIDRKSTRLNSSHVAISYAV